MPNTHPVADVKTTRPRGSQPATNKAAGSSWENIALWLFIAGIFIASAVAAYLFWRKFSFTSP